MTLQTHKSLNINSYRKEKKDQLGNWEIFLIYCPITIIIWQSRTHTESLNFLLRGGKCVESVKTVIRVEAEDEKTCHAIPLNTIRRYMYWLSARIIVFVRFYFFTDSIDTSFLLPPFLCFSLYRMSQGWGLENLILLPLVFFGLFSITIKSLDVY